LLAAGMGAGVGAIFRAPLAGALFAAEILYRESDLEAEVIVPAAVSSITAYSVFSLWLPANVRFVPLFGAQLRHRLGSMLELLPMTLLALGLVGVGIVYIKTFYGIHALFKRLRIPRHIVPMLGALIAGLIGLALYYSGGQDPRSLAVFATGYGTLQQALENPQAMGIGLLAAVALVKILTTSSTIGSGGSGGVFGPSMVIGGCTGAAIGVILHDFWPVLVPNPAIYTIVGMAGFFAGCAHAPISTIIMVSEMTGDYNLLAPTMWVSTLCFLLCRRWTLYDKQVPSRLDSPAHRGDFFVDVLEGLTVNDVPWKQRRTIPEGTSLRAIVRLLAETRQHYFPVVDDEGKFLGIFSTDDVRRYLYDETIWEVANARDAMTSRVLSVAPADDLGTALRRFTERNLDELPVLDANRPTRLLGMLRRKDVIARYNRALADHQRATQEEES
jgi:CIC family chloride channel protein